MLAPVLLVVLRLLQGLSAAGEQAGANSMSFEHSPDDRRGFFTSFTLSGTQGGQILAPAVFLPLAAVLSDDQLQSWGWRIPFWISAIVVFFGLMIRRRSTRRPSSRRRQARRTPSAPLAVLFRDHWRGVLRVFFAAFIATVNTMFAVFALNFATSDDFGIGITTDDAVARDRRQRRRDRRDPVLGDALRPDRPQAGVRHRPARPRHPRRRVPRRDRRTARSP